MWYRYRYLGTYWLCLKKHTQTSVGSQRTSSQNCFDQRACFAQTESSHARKKSDITRIFLFKKFVLFSKYSNHQIFLDSEVQRGRDRNDSYKSVAINRAGHATISYDNATTIVEHQGQETIRKIVRPRCLQWSRHTEYRYLCRYRRQYPVINNFCSVADPDPHGSGSSKKWKSK